MSNQRPDANWPSVVALKTILHVLGLIPVSGDVELMGGHPTPNLCFGLLPFGFTAGNTRAFLEQQLQHTLKFPPLFLNQVKALPAKLAQQRSVG